MTVINRIGGGGDALRIKVRTYTELPETGEKNEIAVISDIEMTGWVMQTAEPAASDGFVWIEPDTDYSTVPFFADRKQQVMIYPKTVKQYVDGAWVTKDASIYQGGKWVTFGTLYLYNKGDECTAVTGGWIEHKLYAASFTKDTDTITLSIQNASNSYVNVRPSNPIDLTKIKTLRVSCTAVGARRMLGVTQLLSDYFNSSGVAQYFTSGNILNYVSTDPVVMELDVSALSGLYYVVLAAGNSGSVDPRTFSFSQVEAVYL